MNYHHVGFRFFKGVLRNNFGKFYMIASSFYETLVVAFL